MKLADLLREINCPWLQTCPSCSNKTLEPGDYVEHWKVTPDRCCICGYIEGNGTEMYPHNYDYVRKCWELQIPPYPELNLD